MATEIPTGLKFQHILAHTFPGFFSSITLFMALDILSPMDLTSTVLWSKGIDGLVAFSGFVLLIGSILGIIIDGIQHWITTEVFEKKDNKIKKLLCERKYILVKYLYFIKNKKLNNNLDINDKCLVDCNNSDQTKCPYRVTCEFCWKNEAGTDEIAELDDKKLKEFLSKTYDINWISTAAKFEKGSNTLSIIKDNKKLTLIFDSTSKKVFLDIDGRKIDEFVAEKVGENWRLFSNECPVEKYNLNRFYLFKALGDRFSPLNELMTELFYSYSEFYLNTFISLIPFSIIAPIYLYKVFQISGEMLIGAPGLAIFVSLLISIISIICYKCSYNAYTAYLIAQNSALSGYVDSITTDLPAGTYAIKDGKINLSVLPDKTESNAYSIKGQVVLGLK